MNEKIIVDILSLHVIIYITNQIVGAITMRKRIEWDHVDGGKNLGQYITETEKFDRNYDTNPFTKVKTPQIGFYKIGKKRRTWLPLGYNVKEVRVFNADTDELIERIIIPENQ